MSKLFNYGLLLSIFLISENTYAGSVSNTLKATSSLNSSCSMSATNIDFGSMNLIAGENNANGSINILCSNKITYTINIAFGHVEPQQTQNGNMIGAQSGDILTYGINSSYHSGYQWGYDHVVSGTGNGNLQTYVTYGRLYTGLYGHSRYPTPDSYSDNALVTLNY